jgi:hypothetical protein
MSLPSCSRLQNPQCSRPGKSILHGQDLQGEREKAIRAGGKVKSKKLKGKK